MCGNGGAWVQSRSHVRRPSLEATGPLGMPAIPTSPNGGRHGASYSLHQQQHQQYGGGGGAIPSWLASGVRSGPTGGVASQQVRWCRCIS